MYREEGLRKPGKYVCDINQVFFVRLEQEAEERKIWKCTSFFYLISWVKNPQFLVIWFVKLDGWWFLFPLFLFSYFLLDFFSLSSWRRSQWNKLRREEEKERYSLGPDFKNKEKCMFFSPMQIFMKREMTKISTIITYIKIIIINSGESSAVQRKISFFSSFLKDAPLQNIESQI